MPVTKTRLKYDPFHTALLDQIFRTTGSQRQSFPREFSVLADRLEEDFHACEAMLDTLGCASAARHREQHAQFLANLRRAIAALHDGNGTPAAHALRDMGQWLPYHLEMLDAELAQAACSKRPLANCH